jgi:hypothetical protein
MKAREKVALLLAKRLAPVLIVGVIILATIIGFYPEQAAVIGRKIGMTAIGMWIGYAAYSTGFKVLPTDNEVALICAKAFLMGVGGLCVSIAV